MNTLEEDAAVGRLIRDYSAARRKAALIRARLERLAGALLELAPALRGDEPSAALALLGGDRLAGWDTSALRAVLEDHAVLRSSVGRMAALLRELGVD